MSKLVRLFPRNVERGWLIQTFVEPELGLKFVAMRGWYEVTDEEAEVLSKVRQKHYDPLSPKAFAIADDIEHAKYIEDNVLNPPKKEDDTVGTITAPIPTTKKRPGMKSNDKPSKAEPAKKIRPKGRPRGRKRSMTAGE